MNSNRYTFGLFPMQMAAITTIALTSLSCDSFVSINPPESQIVTESVFNDWSTANAAMTAIYPQMASFNHTLQTFLGWYGDEFATEVKTGINFALYSNTVDPVTNNPSRIWDNGFNIIYQANAVIEGATNSGIFTEQEKTQLIGEALFVRSFLNFYLLNIYGDIPLVRSTDYKINNRLPRTPAPEVMQQIIADLIESSQLLGSDYIDAKGNAGTNERVRPNKFAALSLLSRAYLYDKQFENAERMATEILAHSSLYDTVRLSDVFSKNSKEAIWQIPPSVSGSAYFTPDGRNYIIATNTVNQYLTDYLLDAFDPEDLRKDSWIGTYLRTNVNPPKPYYYPYKYKNGADNTIAATEYYTALRLAEQYLIRAEARFYLNNIAGAKQDLNVIRNRAGLANTEANSSESLFNEIIRERQVEFFCEWGHRWFDLKRTGLVDDVMQDISSEKGGNWLSFKTLWPIQQVELNRNPNLTQNPGYNNLANGN